tara:strand:- start:13949 stop:16351 length:2403 start_codon:yes stop_codon:yes gene_type:complete
MATFQDTFDNEDNVNELLSSEVTGGELNGTSLDADSVLEFDGTNYVLMESVPFPVGPPTTIAAWVRIDDISVGPQVIATFCNSDVSMSDPGNDELGIRYNGSQGFEASMIDGGSGNAATDSDKPQQGKWYHVVGLFVSSSEAHIYVNGKLKNSMASGGNPTCDRIAVGVKKREYDADINFLTGKVDDVRMWDVALTTEQIEELYYSSEEPDVTNLELHWEFNEGSGTDATDSTGNGNTGTLTNSPAWVTDSHYYAPRSRTTSENVLSAVSSDAVNSFAYTLSQKSGGEMERVQFSNDGSTWVNSNGDDVINGGHWIGDGSTSYIDIASNIDDFGINHFPGNNTICCWFKSSNQTDFMNFLYQSINGTVENGWLRLEANRTSRPLPEGSSYHTGKISWNHKSGNSSTHRLWAHVDGEHVLDGRWHHAAWRKTSDTNIDCFLDGVQMAVTIDYGGPYEYLGTPSSINSTGIASTSSTRFWDGELDDMRFYSGALTDDEIVELYRDSIEPTSGTLVAHYKMDGDATDATGNGHDGTDQGSSTYNTDWYLTQPFGDVLGDTNALSFDGSDDYAHIASLSVDGYSAITISAWIKTPAVLSDSEFMSFPEGLAGANGCALLVSGEDYVEFRFRTGGVVKNVSDTDINHNDNKWHHIAGTYDGITGRLYIDGLEVATAAATGTIDAAAGECFFGLFSTTAPATRYKGLMANAALWNDARTPTEILASYNNGYEDTTDGNMVAYWKFDEDTAATSTAVDSKNGNDATISGPVTAISPDRPITELTQATIDLSALSYTDAFYYRLFSSK